VSTLKSTPTALNQNEGLKFESQLGLRAGDTVQVRSKDEILSTLDSGGCLDLLPFMPEMLAHCGQQFRVRSVAHRTCDTVSSSGGRRLRDCVHLEELRCSGCAHGGCQAECLLFWKEAWLIRTLASSLQLASELTAAPTASSKPIDVRLEQTITGSHGQPVYSCQATRLLEFTMPLNPRDPSPYWADWRTGNVTLGRLFETLFFRAIVNTIQHVGYKLLTSFYNWIAKLRGSDPFPIVGGRVAKTPAGVLDLTPGERVRVRSIEEIGKTLNSDGNNRGLNFDWEMIPYCGKTFTVKKRVDQIINESTGEMMHFKNPCIILDEVICGARYSGSGRIKCPRAIYSYWREIWLERIDLEEDRKADNGRS
jgi:hypothetical protein